MIILENSTIQTDKIYNFPDSLYIKVPLFILKDKRLSCDLKLFAGLIYGYYLSNFNIGHPNEYYAQLFDVDEKTIRSWICDLKDFGYIKKDMYNSKEVILWIK